MTKMVKYSEKVAGVATKLHRFSCVLPKAGNTTFHYIHHGNILGTHTHSAGLEQ